MHMLHVLNGAPGSLSVQEKKQLERQEHLEEQHRLHLSINWLDQANSSLASNATNGTDHVDDFIRRIDKLRQVSTMRAFLLNPGIYLTPCSQCCTPTCHIV